MHTRKCLCGPSDEFDRRKNDNSIIDTQTPATDRPTAEQKNDIGSDVTQRKQKKKK